MEMTVVLFPVGNSHRVLGEDMWQRARFTKEIEVKRGYEGAKEELWVMGPPIETESRGECYYGNWVIGERLGLWKKRVLELQPEFREDVELRYPTGP